MKRVVLVAVAGIVLTVSSAVGATQHEVALTSTGPQPTALTVGWGDSVVFTNRDTVPHELLIPRLEVTVDLAPGAAHSQAFAVRQGAYPFRQRIGNRSVQGMITVEVKGTVALRATPKVLVTGRSLAVAGTSPYGGTPVELVVRTPGSGEWAPLRTLTASPSGAFATSVRLSRGASLQARVADGQLRSPIVSFTVQPTLALTASPRRLAAGGTVRLAARLRPAGAASAGTLERFDAERKRWDRVGTMRLGRTGVAATTTKAEEGSNRFRLVVSRASTTPGYLAVTSPTVTVVGR